ncbi:transposase [Bergeyella zoohelcum]|uniref:Transposase DDE domain n=1 Tax=Bergeyella zoohelcum TaxID=1015 RepID=A0A7Z8YN67_9FLAO|nr:transposase [Bergeyella zoohelcum]VDH03315.1 Transposase DDE domain [Bergeyella zoohelcum]
MSFAAYDVERRTRKGSFSQVDTIIDWKSISAIIDKHHQKGLSASDEKSLSKWEKVFNKWISKTHWVVERTFGSQKRWFGVGQTRLKDLDKVHTQHILEAIAYNLKRSPKMGILPAF